MSIVLVAAVPHLVKRCTLGRNPNPKSISQSLTTTPGRIQAADGAKLRFTLDLRESGTRRATWLRRIDLSEVGQVTSLGGHGLGGGPVRVLALLGHLSVHARADVPSQLLT